jgi:hypothetical protein
LLCNSLLVEVESGSHELFSTGGVRVSSVLVGEGLEGLDLLGVELSSNEGRIVHPESDLLVVEWLGLGKSGLWHLLLDHWLVSGLQGLS